MSSFQDYCLQREGWGTDIAQGIGRVAGNIAQGFRSVQPQPSTARPVARPVAGPQPTNAIQEIDALKQHLRPLANVENTWKFVAPEIKRQYQDLYSKFASGIGQLMVKQGQLGQQQDQQKRSQATAANPVATNPFAPATGGPTS